MSKGKSLPPALKSMLASPLYPARPAALHKGATIPAGRAAGPTPPAPSQKLLEAFQKVKGEAEQKGVGWGEWLSIAVSESPEGSPPPEDTGVLMLPCLPPGR